MKKNIYSLLMLAMAAFAFTSCEDVPMPYDMPGSASDKDEPIVQLVGDGTAANPYNVASALYLITEGKITEDNEYVEGIISKIDEIDTSTRFGNATYYISDDGTTANHLEVYRGYSLGGAKFKSDTEIKVGDKVIVYGQLVYFNQKTPEFTQGNYIYSLNGQTAGDTPTGETIGSLDNPKTCAEALALINALADGAETDGNAYVKGKVVKVTTNQTNFEKYGNLNYWISDDGSETNQIQVYSGDGLNGEKFKSITDIGPGDEVVVYGKLYKYVKDGNMTPEINKGNYLVKLTKGQGGGSDTPPSSNSSTIDNPYSVAKALETTNALADNETTTDNFYIKGKVSRKANTADEIGPNSSKKYKDMNYYISDDGTQSKEIYVYRGKYLDGADFTDFEQLKEGDEVIIYGQLQKYIDTKNGNAVVPEVKNSKIVKLNGQGGSGGEGGSGGGTGDNETGDNGTFESWSDSSTPTNWKTTSTAGNATLSQSTDAHGGKYSCLVEGSTAANKRLGYKELKLAAGTYNVKFYAKAQSEGGSLRPGFVEVVNGTANSSYNYISGYIDNVGTSEWTLVEVTFEIPSAATYCFVIMNQKKSTAVNFLIDDFTVTSGGKSIIK